MMPAELDGDRMSHCISVLPPQITQICCSTCLIPRSGTLLGCRSYQDLWWFGSAATFLKFENILDPHFTSRTSGNARQSGGEPFLWAVFVCNSATTPTSRPCRFLLEGQVCTEKTRGQKKKRLRRQRRVLGLRCEPGSHIPNVFSPRQTFVLSLKC